MSFTYLKPMPSPEEIQAAYPMSEQMTALKADRDRQIADIITGKDDRVLAIIGPCSADNEDSVCEYVNRLTAVQEKIKTESIIHKSKCSPVKHNILIRRRNGSFKNG